MIVNNMVAGIFVCAICTHAICFSNHLYLDRELVFAFHANWGSFRRNNFYETLIKCLRCVKPEAAMLCSFNFFLNTCRLNGGLPICWGQAKELLVLWYMTTTLAVWIMSVLKQFKYNLNNNDLVLYLKHVMLNLNARGLRLASWALSSRLQNLYITYQF